MEGGGAFLSLRNQQLSLDLTYYHALKSKYGGGFQLGGSYLLFQDQGTALYVGGDLGWGDSDAMSTYFGVSAAEAKASAGRLAQHSTSSGLRLMAVHGTFSQQLSTNWNFYSSLGVKHLLGDAANSPITQRKTSIYGGVRLSYSFR